LTGVWTKRLLAVALTAVAGTVLFQVVDLGDLGRRLAQVRPHAAAQIVLLFVVSAILAAWRLHRALAHFGSPVPVGVSLRASTAGLVSSLFVIGIFGALAGRQAVLRGAGVSAGAVALTVAYERLAVAAVGALACAIAAGNLYAEAVVGTLVDSLALGPLAIVAAVALVWHLRHASSVFERAITAVLTSPRTIVHGIEMLILAGVGQMLAISAYVVAARAMGAETAVGDLALAGAVVSFAASLPISINGWGIREIAAVSAFGALGIGAEPAAALSILVGLCATVAVVGLVPILMLPLRAGRTTQPDSGALGQPDFDAAFAGLAALGAGILVFFQTHVYFDNAYVSVNLADPIALLALGVAGAGAISARARPGWLSAEMAGWFAATSAVLVVGFAIGAAQFGITGWALNNRLIGWLILLGYFSAGASAAGLLGVHGARRVLETFVLVGATIVVVYSVERLMPLFGIGVWPSTFDYSGYAANRNAFAFQLLVAACAALALSEAAQRTATRWVRPLPIALGLIVFGIWQTRSLAGAISGASILLALGFLGEGARATAIRAIVWAFAFFGLHEAVTWIGLWSPSASGDIAYYTQPPALLRGTSLAERFLSMRQGLELWLEHPIFGAGLGAFYRLGLGSVITQLVIHSTPIWILAEFGIVGAIIIASYPTVRIFGWIRGENRSRSVRSLFIVGLVLLFMLFSQVHEIAYQRVFWLALGAAVGLAGSGAKPNILRP